VLGEVNGGWAVAMSLLGLERGEEAATNPIFFRAELDRIIELARECGRIDDPVIRDRLAWCYTKVEVMRFLGLRILSGYLKSGGARAGVVDLEALLERVPPARSRPGAGDPRRAGRWCEKGGGRSSTSAPTNRAHRHTTASWIDVALLNARSGTVYAGTSQVQRNILGETILGLPKEPA